MKDTILGVAQFTLIRMREPAFLILLAFAMIFGYFISGIESFSFQEDLLLAQLSFSTSQKPVMGSFFMIICLTALMGVFSGSSEIPRDIDSRMILLILGKPVSRLEYIIGKFVGILIISVCFFAASGLTVFIAQFIKTGSFFPLSTMLRQSSLIFAIIPFVALNVMISCFLTEISAMIVSVIYISFSFFLCSIPILMELLPRSMGIRSPLLTIYYFFPNFYYYMIPMRVNGLVIIFLIVYSVSVSAIFLMIADMKFRTRDIL